MVNKALKTFVKMRFFSLESIPISIDGIFHYSIVVNQCIQHSSFKRKINSLPITTDIYRSQNNRRNPSFSRISCCCWWWWWFFAFVFLLSIMFEKNRMQKDLNVYHMSSRKTCHFATSRALVIASLSISIE